MTRIGCVVLTTGDRPQELAAAIDSVHQQLEVEVEVCVVWNDPTAPRKVPAGVAVAAPGVNLGIPEGRNVGVAALPPVDLVFFLDDDGMLAEADALFRAAEDFEQDPSLAAITMRIIDPDSGRTERRHVPRVRVGDPARSSWVTTFLGGATVLRRSALDEVGGLPGEFFYAHEETSLAWRLLDAGYRIRYRADLHVHHPAMPPARHPGYYELSARNRVLLARKHLPAPLAVVYLFVWISITLVRNRRSGAIRPSLRGFATGLSDPEIDRRPISWRTVWRMTTYGRPPIV
jgi:GT2 family glycosyltransferase